MLQRLVAARVGGVAILDGGMGTFLDTHGVVEPWSTGYRIDDPVVRTAVKLGYSTFLKSGCDLLTVNTYNVSAECLKGKGLTAGATTGLLAQKFGSIDEAEVGATIERLFVDNVKLAQQAVDDFLQEKKDAESDAKKIGEETPAQRPDPVLVGSMGCYGTCVPGRAETANRECEGGAEEVALQRLPAYGIKDGAGKATLIAFHEQRVKAAVAAGLRLLAFETVPDLIEAHAIAEVMNAHAAAGGVEIEGWVVFTCGSDDKVDNGALFSDCLAALEGCASITGVGINCTAPEHVVPLLKIASAQKTGKLLVCYPNSGETYLMRPLRDGESVHWKRESGGGVDGAENVHNCYADMADSWHAAGASVIGGCCRVTPEDIAGLNARFPRK